MSERREVNTPPNLPWRSEERQCGMNRYRTIVDVNGHSVIREGYAGDYSGSAWAEFDDEEIIPFVCRAVNAHQALVEALRGIAPFAEEMIEDYAADIQEGGRMSTAADKWHAVLAALKLAEASRG